MPNKPGAENDIVGEVPTLASASNLIIWVDNRCLGYLLSCNINRPERNLTFDTENLRKPPLIYKSQPRCLPHMRIWNQQKTPLLWPKTLAAHRNHGNIIDLASLHTHYHKPLLLKVYSFSNPRLQEQRNRRQRPNVCYSSSLHPWIILQGSVVLGKLFEICWDADVKEVPVWGLTWHSLWHHDKALVFWP